MSETSETTYESVVTWTDEEGLTHRGAPTAAGYVAYLERKKSTSDKPADAETASEATAALRRPASGPAAVKS